METIELVVKMPRYAFDEIKKHYSVFSVYVSHVECMHDAIKNGIPLPKGHGRLIDADKFESEHFGKVARFVDDAPTIIEADKEGAEE